MCVMCLGKYNGCLNELREMAKFWISIVQFT